MISCCCTLCNMIAGYRRINLSSTIQCLRKNVMWASHPLTSHWHWLLVLISYCCYRTRCQWAMRRWLYRWRIRSGMGSNSLWVRRFNSWMVMCMLMLGWEGWILWLWIRINLLCLIDWLGYWLWYSGLIVSVFTYRYKTTNNK